MKIGFTGTRKGMSIMQLKGIFTILAEIDSMEEIHHGGCVGSDSTFHLSIPHKFVQNIIVHPGDEKQFKRFNKIGKWKTLQPKPYLQRNKDIVDNCELLIACPKGKEVVRSGTWATIRYARKIKRKILIIARDGKLVIENGNASFNSH